LNDYSDKMMFCSDDKHPDSLAEGHINDLCKRAVAKGIDIFKVLQAACINPVEHYKMNVGLLRTGDAADFIVVEDLKNFKVFQTYVDGELVAENGKTKIHPQRSEAINHFECNEKEVEDFRYNISDFRFDITSFPLIEALDGQLITNQLIFTPNVVNGCLEGDVDNDILKMVVVNRYQNAPVAKAFVKNFGLKKGAIASSVAHDSHNIIAVGVDDKSICEAVNLIIQAKGGVSCVSDDDERMLPLHVAGLMSNEDGYIVADLYTAIDKDAKELGSTLTAPFMTLSFMALLVIPHLKLSDKGLFDGNKFSFV
jgi:adenine deaminase